MYDSPGDHPGRRWSQAADYRTELVSIRHGEGDDTIGFDRLVFGSAGQISEMRDRLQRLGWRVVIGGPIDHPVTVSEFQGYATAAIVEAASEGTTVADWVRAQAEETQARHAAVPDKYMAETVDVLLEVRGERGVVDDHSMAIIVSDTRQRVDQLERDLSETRWVGRSTVRAMTEDQVRDEFAWLFFPQM